MTAISRRVVLTEDEGRQLFREQLPRSGTIQRTCTSRDGSHWSLVLLDRPFDYQVQDSQNKLFRGFEVKRILIRSRWAGYSVGGQQPTSVFVLLAEDERLFDIEPINPKDFHFEAWAMCQNEAQG